tara:strand:+ start:6302 stop:8479 length:2178 start_codon:yes stop_codon:yes gene_type:complete
MADQTTSDLLEYKSELINTINIGATETQSYSEVAFLDSICEILSDAGIYENIEQQSYRNKSKGMKIDGFSYNSIEGVLSGIVVKYSNDASDLTTISKSEIETLGKQAAKFLENVDNEKFISSLALTDPGKQLAESITELFNYVDPETKEKNKFIKFRIVIVTDCILSDRVKDLKKIALMDIRGTESAFEMWDLKRIQSLESSGNESEPIEVDFGEWNNFEGLETLSANIKEKEMSSYICVLPGKVLWKLFDDYGQRLLESNVRTFLSFRGKVNNGMRATLLKNPENFFAYNNGLTVTASSIKTKQSGNCLLITKLDNMQIVNGGQTTSSIYFSPLEKGQQDGLDYRDIDLSKVFVQMKLTVIEDPGKEEILKSNIAQFANTQNPIQAADLVANHPLHIRLEALSRKHSMPPGESGLATKWFYERARGQYETKLRAILGKSKKDKFVLEHPKNQKFTKTDMAKFENTFRMKPNEVKQGAQKNLELIGKNLVNEWDKDPKDFEFGFYKDLIAKAILFKSADKAIMQSDWYKLAPGFKADIVTYTLALLRHFLIRINKDLNLKRIYDNQKISDSLNKEILELAYIVRKNLMDLDFREGDANPSSFGKKLKAWEKYQTIDYEIQHLSNEDMISGNDLKDASKLRNKIDETSHDLNVAENCLNIDKNEWMNIYNFIRDNKITSNHTELKIVERLQFAQYRGSLRIPEDYEKAWKLRKQAIDFGYIPIEND